MALDRIVDLPRLGLMRRKPGFIALADHARDAGQWELAARLFARALRRNPRNPPIWVQYGHALKESGELRDPDKLARAEVAYRRALSLDPGAADPHLHLGHVLKLQGKTNDAEASYLRAFAIDPSLSHPLHELGTLGWSDAQTSELTRLAAHEPVDAGYTTFRHLNSGINAESYELPQGLRDYIIERFGDDTISPVQYLMGIVSLYEENAKNFVASQHCVDLLVQLKRLARDLDPKRPIDVSIILPIYNGLVFTLTCLYSLLATPTQLRFEVLIGDDASTDGSRFLLSSIGGRVIHIRHATNVGFLLNCNVTSTHARGRFIVVLNNDTIVLPGWLDELIGTFDSHSNVGYVGSKLLNSDGTLQEAGGILWSDGSAWNYGRNQDPCLAEFNYAKEVDYCSGTSLAIPTNIWKTLGGFDPAFAPAYCEDSDLAFRARAIGMKTYYQPFSELIHHEGKSNGRDTSTGIKAYQISNSEKLWDRWRTSLESEHLSAGHNVFLARDRTRLRPHILVVDHYVPQWDRDAGSRTIYNFLTLFLDAGFHVSFWPDNLCWDPIYAKTLQQLGVEVISTWRYVGRFNEWIKSNGNFLKYIFLSRPNTSTTYIDVVKDSSTAAVLYYGHDLHWRRLEMEYDITKDPAILADLEHTRVQEDAVCRRADVIFYPSEEECRIIRQRIPDKQVARVPAYLFDRGTTDEARQRIVLHRDRDSFSLLFVGGFSHKPNVDGIVWFIEEIFPRLRKRNNKFRLTVIGSNAPPAVLNLASDDIALAGQVEDQELRRLYRNAAVAIVPLRFGGGVKLKVIEGFANGIPVVSTSVGLQGIEDGDRLAFVADETTDFAEQVSLACSDHELARAKCRRALEYVEEMYSRHAMSRSFSPYVTELKGSMTSI
jgi:GT2 family glycosyltransferase